MTSPYLTAKEAAAYLKFGSIKSLYRAVVTQQIPHVRRGTHTLLFRSEALDAWLADSTRPAPTIKRSA